MPGASVPYLAYFFPGVVLMVVLFASIFTTASVIEDRHRGFLQSVLAAPGSRGALVAGKTLGSAAVALTQAVLFLALAPLAGFPYSSVDWPLLLSALALAAIALAALGFAVAWGIDNVQGYHAIQMTLLVPLWVVSGAMFPAPAGEGALGAVMRANPVAYAVSAARRALGGAGTPGTLPGSAARDLAVCALFATGALALGARGAEVPPVMSLGEVLPTVNAILNGAAFVLLLLGFVAIRRGDRRRHHALMLSACGASALFLVSYLTRIALTGTHRFPGEGTLRVVYLAVLTSHTILAALAAPLVLRTLFLALRDRGPRPSPDRARDAADLDVRLGDGRGRLRHALPPRAVGSPTTRAPPPLRRRRRSARARLGRTASGPAPTRGALRGREPGERGEGVMQEPAAEPRAGVDEQVREPFPLERHPHHPLHRVRRNARPRDASHAQRLLAAGARAHAAPDAALEIDVRREGAPALSVLSARDHRDRGDRAGARAPRAAHAGVCVLARLEAARVHRREPVPGDALQLLAAAATAVAHERRPAHDVVGELHEAPRAGVREDAQRLVARIARPKPRRTTNSAPPFRDRQISIGASHALPRCSASWRQKQSETAHARASPTTEVARSQSRTSGSGSSEMASSCTSARPTFVSRPNASFANAGSRRGRRGAPRPFASSGSSRARMSEYSKNPTTGGESR